MTVTTKQSSSNELKKHFDFIFMDLVAVEFSYFLAVLWYYNTYGKVLDFGGEYRQQFLILFVCFFASITVTQPYKNILKRDKWQELNAVVKHTVYMAVMDILLMYIMKDFTSTSRLTFAATWIFYIIIETSFRLLWKRKIRSYILKHISSRKQIVVLTSRDRIKNIAENLDVYLFRDFDVCGVFLTDYDETKNKGVIVNHAQVLGNAKDMIDF